MTFVPVPHEQFNVLQALASQIQHQLSALPQFKGNKLTSTVERSVVTDSVHLQFTISEEGTARVILDVFYPTEVISSGRLNKVRIVRVWVNGKNVDKEIRNPAKVMKDFIIDIQQIPALAPFRPDSVSREAWAIRYGNVPACPRCGHPMLRLKNKAGTYFWGCTKFTDSDCKGSIDVWPDDPAFLSPKCDDCGSPMRYRADGAKGPFWGCTGYPDCRRTFDHKAAKPASIEDWMPPLVKKVDDAMSGVIMADLNRGDLFNLAKKRGINLDPHSSREEITKAILEDDDRLSSKGVTDVKVAQPEKTGETLESARDRWRKRS